VNTNSSPDKHLERNDVNEHIFHLLRLEAVTLRFIKIFKKGAIMRTKEEVEKLIREYASHFDLCDQVAFELLYRGNYLRVTIVCDIDKERNVIDETGELRLFLKSENVSINKNWDDEFP